MKCISYTVYAIRTLLAIIYCPSKVSVGDVFSSQPLDENLFDPLASHLSDRILRIWIHLLLIHGFIQSFKEKWEIPFKMDQKH